MMQFFTSIIDERGQLSAYELDALKFRPRRIYTIDSVPENMRRGAHAHKELSQYIVALKGKFSISVVDRSLVECSVEIKSEGPGIYLEPCTWRELHSFSTDAICLVFASLPYDPEDYIWCKDEFEIYAKTRN